MKYPVPEVLLLLLLLLYHTPEEWKELNDEQKNELRKWRENNLNLQVKSEGTSCETFYITSSGQMNMVW
jgi:hypothetical protein